MSTASRQKKIVILGMMTEIPVAGNVLPVGRALFGFSSMDDILAAVDAINSDYAGHCRAAGDRAREYFNYDVVLRRMLDEIGV